MAGGSARGSVRHEQRVEDIPAARGVYPNHKLGLFYIVTLSTVWHGGETTA